VADGRSDLVLGEDGDPHDALLGVSIAAQETIARSGPGESRLNSSSSMISLGSSGSRSPGVMPSASLPTGRSSRTVSVRRISAS
jgi:hypothetical protein